MTTAIQELEALQAQQARARKERQREASGKHAVEEIYRKQGERLASEFDWQSHWGKRLPETCRSLLQRLGSAAGMDNPHAHDDYTVCRAAISSPAL